MKGIRKTHVFLAILVLVAIVYGGCHIAWNWYASNTFDSFLNSERLLTIPEEDYELIQNKGWEIHTYRDYDRSGYLYQVSIPPRLNFGGHVSLTTPMNVHKNEYMVDLMIYTGHRNWRYVLSIAQLSGDNQKDIRLLGSAVDMNGLPLERHPEDAEEFYREWLALYEINSEFIMKMFMDMKLFFSEVKFQ
jgi:hypothetical protein